MLADAETGAFEVLLCYDTSRFARNVADAWTYRDQLARCGVIVVFCADGLISGNVDTYELEGLKTVADAAYIPAPVSETWGNGYAQKWRLYSDPGGNAPLGFARVGERQLLAPVEGPDLDRVRRAFELYATGAWSDTNLADELGLAEAGLTEILTNPLYAGRAIRHKGKPDQDEKPRPSRRRSTLLCSSESRRSASNAGPHTAQVAAPTVAGRIHLVPLMRCLGCGSRFTATRATAAGAFDIAPARRAECRPRTARVVRKSSWPAPSIDLRFDEVNIEQVLTVMRQFRPPPSRRTRTRSPQLGPNSKHKLAAGSIGIDVFSRAWRRMERPEPAEAMSRTRRSFARLATPWASSALSGAIRRCRTVFASKPSTTIRSLRRRGGTLVAAHPQPNENAWLIGPGADGCRIVAYATCDGYGRGERISADTPSPILLIPVTKRAELCSSLEAG